METKGETEYTKEIIYSLFIRKSVRNLFHIRTDIEKHIRIHIYIKRQKKKRTKQIDKCTRSHKTEMMIVLHLPKFQSQGSHRHRWNVAASMTGKVSKLYSGLRISRISIPYYTTYYLTQASPRVPSSFCWLVPFSMCLFL